MNTASTQSGSRSVSITNINLPDVLEDIFMVLSDKEKDVIVKRFSLNNGPKMTLEKIGQQFSVTRERIRQIEKIALNKLRRTVNNTKLKDISALALEIVQENGGIITEKKLISSILNILGSKEQLEAHIIGLALNITPGIEKTEKSNLFYPFWRLEAINEKSVRMIIDAGISVLNKNSDLISGNDIASQIEGPLNEKGLSVGKTTIVSALETDKRVKKIKDEFGLMSWRHINPKSIRDKAFIVLKKLGKPLHFIDIANKISESEFDKKVVTTQAVHNELIRYDQFVLVGRGLYALKEWGYKKGTVADVIEDILAKKSPLSKQEIILAVLKQRQVKKGTISLNLQKNQHFVRVGRAMYSLDKSKK